MCRVVPLLSGQQQGRPDSSTNKFDAKTDKGSADLYFHYYGMLQHQQNMLQVSLANTTAGTSLKHGLVTDTLAPPPSTSGDMLLASCLRCLP